ncbi:uncharacterized protein [Brachionichthys hirsutus]|uniref:uncharacterized protein isoform X2 n=1 Tax=Brachionichthys hirsutus TaxID=412623 RepID=UPI0036049C02
MFESFLQKRKDTMKMWVTYWFRLQSTTLFFYTKKNGSASHLRGSYYIYTVQSVRQVHSSDGKRFMFEIVMTNGKRKVLAAETAALRQEWIEHLWQAMHLSSSRDSDSRRRPLQVSEQPERTDGDPVEEPPSPQGLSASADHAPPDNGGTSFPGSLSEELNGDKSPPSTNGLNIADEDEDEVDYDVLPARNEEAQTDQVDEDLYDFPVSFRGAAAHPENIYDVPSRFMGMPPDRDSAFSSEEQREDRLYQRTGGPV